MKTKLTNNLEAAREKHTLQTETTLQTMAESFSKTHEARTDRREK